MSVSAGAEITVKTIGANGQISLGKQFAGRQVMIENAEPGVWVIREALVIPVNETFLHRNNELEKLGVATAWAANSVPQEADLDALESELNGKKTAQRRRKGQA